MKSRIWELDALRGICILGMVAVHFIYDLTELYAVVDWQWPAWFSFVKSWGGVLFFLLSGVCVTLGHRSVRRGLIVFACGMLCTAVTYGMVAFGLAGSGLTIWFGVLHCLGACMLLWPLCKKLPLAGLAIVAAGAIAFGFWLHGQVFSFPYLVALGFVPAGFASSDYFPLFPYLGFFLAGAVIGRTAYREKKSLLPRVNAQTPALRAVCFCGRHSLEIYLLHQPALSALIGLVTALKE